MGIREDAEAAHATVVAEQEAAAKVKADREAAEQEAATNLAKNLLDDWAQRMGYAGDVVITDIRSTSNPAAGVSTVVLFHIDDIDFCGYRGTDQKLVVRLAEDRNLGIGITDIPSLGAALAMAKARNI